MSGKIGTTKLPTALVIGPMRSATTWVYRYLKDRDDVCTPTDVKETFFFDRRYEKGLEWYERHFQNCQKEEGQLVMEVGPSYFHSQKAPQRIRDTLGRIPLVVIHRDPVERSFSHFAHLRRYGFTSLPLQEAVEEFPEILTASRYAEQIERWIHHFGTDPLTVLRLETLKTSPTQFAANLTESLGLSFEPVPEELESPVNRSTVPESNLLAGVAWRVADVLRGWRLHRVVEWAKQLGVKDVAMKKAKGTRSEMSEAEREWLREQLKDDMQRTSQVLLEVEES